MSDEPAVERQNSRPNQDRHSKNDRYLPWRKRTKGTGLENPAKRAMDRGELPYFQPCRWKYIGDSDWETWLTRFRRGDLQ